LGYTLDSGQCVAARKSDGSSCVSSSECSSGSCTEGTCCGHECQSCDSDGDCNDDDDGFNSYYGTSKEQSEIGGAAIAGAVIGGLLAFGGLIAGIVCFVVHRQKTETPHESVVVKWDDITNTHAAETVNV
jgi:hypothetical protein